MPGECLLELEFKHENFCIELEFEKDVVPETLQANISATKYALGRFQYIIR